MNYFKVYKKWIITSHSECGFEYSDFQNSMASFISIPIDLRNNVYCICQVTSMYVVLKVSLSGIIKQQKFGGNFFGRLQDKMF